MNFFVRSFPCVPFLLLFNIARFSVFASEDDLAVDRLDEPLAGNNVVGAQDNGMKIAFGNVAIFPNGDAAELRFEKLIFSHDGSAAINDQRIKAEREVAINALDRAFRLTENQKRKLDLAGEIDRRRFLSQVQAACQSTRGGLVWNEKDQNTARELQARATAGLLGPGSFFTKSIPVIMDQNQLALLNERKRSIHSGLIRNALRDFEARLTLSEQQSKSLTQIMLDEIPYDLTSENGELLAARSERIIMMYRLSCIANEKIEPLFDPAQWLKVRPMLEECYHYQEYLIGRGLLAPDADVVQSDHPVIRMKEPK